MKILHTEIDGFYIIEPNIIRDERGEFIKVFNQEVFTKENMAVDFKESYFSVSKKNVIRGMHFQAPPQAHEKVVYVTNGAITDVILDIRRGSSTYGRFVAVELSKKNRKIVYIPIGCAHGFLSLQDDSCVTYLQTTMYSPDCDMGIHVGTFGMDWSVKDLIMSLRDKDFPAFKDFLTPFV